MKSIVVVVLAALLMLSSCGDDEVMNYNVIELEGMPCIVARSNVQGWTVNGITCDWSKWTGNR